MNAILTINTNGIELHTILNNILIEEFPEGVMIHADGDFRTTILKQNIVSITDNDEEYRIEGNNALILNLKWV